MTHDYDPKTEEEVVVDPNERWRKGLPHHSMSEKIYEHIADVDFRLSGDLFCWKRGGDGDNGESLMFEMDSFFELQDIKASSMQPSD